MTSGAAATRATARGFWSGAKARFPALFALWWGLFLLANWSSQVALRLSLPAEDASAFQKATVAYFVSDATDFLAAFAAILVVRRTTTRQEERGRRVATGFDPS